MLSLVGMGKGVLDRRDLFYEYCVGIVAKKDDGVIHWGYICTQHSKSCFPVEVMI